MWSTAAGMWEWLCKSAFLVTVDYTARLSQLLWWLYKMPQWFRIRSYPWCMPRRVYSEPCYHLRKALLLCNHGYPDSLLASPWKVALLNNGKGGLEWLRSFSASRSLKRLEEKCQGTWREMGKICWSTRVVWRIPLTCESTQQKKWKVQNRSRSP